MESLSGWETDSLKQYKCKQQQQQQQQQQQLQQQQ